MLVSNTAFFMIVTTPTFEDVSNPVNNRVEKYPVLLTSFQDPDTFDITEKCNNIFQAVTLKQSPETRPSVLYGINTEWAE